MVLQTFPGKAVVASGESDELQRRADTRHMLNGGNPTIQTSDTIMRAAPQGPQLWQTNEPTKSRQPWECGMSLFS
ncbi:hypothetical protein JCM15764A_33390 [Geotalea toluenoxydans]